MPVLVEPNTLMPLGVLPSTPQPLPFCEPHTPMPVLPVPALTPRTPVELLPGAVGPEIHPYIFDPDIVPDLYREP